ncbi:MAG: sigma-70 family RNA polymerase sigma factor [Planctomycetia bacterium]|nr:sigma-70 family RNA polymerase sigma factor [Planctomycetia bacterium]
MARRRRKTAIVGQAVLKEEETRLPVVRAAHDNSNPEQRKRAQQQLIEQYGRAVMNYLIGAVRDKDVADELFQEFSLKLVRGDFKNADPEKGRFRDFIRTALINLIRDYQRRKRRRCALPDEATKALPDRKTAAPSDPSTEESLAKLILAAMGKLAEDQIAKGTPYYTVLGLHIEHRHFSASDLAQRLNEIVQIHKPYTADGVRKILQRARQRFTQHIIDLIAASINTHAPESLIQELENMGLLSYCVKFLEKAESLPEH